MAHETGPSRHNIIPDCKDNRIIDIRSPHGVNYLSQEIKDSLKTPASPQGPRRIPNVLLWDQEGLKRFEEITYLDEYYPTQTEIGILERTSNEIAQKMKPDSILIELGSGNLRKVKILLQALDNISKSVDYYALDLSLPELERTLAAVPPGAYTNVRCHGLLGTYDDGHAWLQLPENMKKSRCIITLGSTIGSFSRPDAAAFLAGFADVLNGNSGSLTSQKGSSAADSCMIIGLDGCKDETKISRAYNDDRGTNARFIVNALEHANLVLGYTAFRHDDWYVQGEWNPVSGSHDQFVIPRKDVDLFESVSLKAGEKILVVHSHKYEAEEKTTLWRDAHLIEVGRWSNDDDSYGIHMLYPNMKKKEY